MKNLLLFTITILPLIAIQAQDRNSPVLHPQEAGPDYAVQGEYLGKVDLNGSEVDMALQVIARGNGEFDSVAYFGGFPGEGWQGTDETKLTASGKTTDGTLVLTADNGHAEVKGGSAEIFGSGDERLGSLKKVSRKSDTLGATPPEGAVVLFDGTTAEQFINGRMSDDQLLMQGVTSKQKFGSYRLHLEFLLSWMPYARGQGRANSGCYHQGRYEVQILDSFGLEGRDNECGGIYSIAPPSANLCYPPLSWQTYDAEFHAAEFDESGEKQKHAWITVLHNGVKIHDEQQLDHATTASPLREGPEDGPVYLQDHGNPIRFRNIWVQPIE